MKKFPAILTKSTLLACLIAVAAVGCSKDKSTSAGAGGSAGSEAGSAGDSGKGGSGGDAGGKSSKGGSTSKKTTSAEAVGGEGGAIGSGGTSEVLATITRLTASVAGTNLRIVSKQTATVAVTIGREGSDEGEVNVAAQGLPAGVGCAVVKVASGSNTAQLQIKVGESAQVGGPYVFTVVVTSAENESVATSVSMVLFIAGAAGERDASFGSAGYLATTVIPTETGGTPRPAFPTSLAVDSKGRVVIGGYSNGANQNGWVVRIKSDGSLDPTLAETGKLINFGTPSSVVSSVAYNNDQLYVAANGSTPYLRKLADNGTTDPAFNTGLDVTLSGQSRIMAAFKGGMLVAPNGIPSLISVSGSVDTSFTVDNVVLANSIAVDSQARVAYAGSTATGHTIRRVQSSGAADTTFGTGGVVTSTCTTDATKTFGGAVNAVLPMPNESVVVLVNCGAMGRDPYEWESELLAFSLTGLPIVGFGQSGRQVITKLGSGVGAVAQPDGKIVVLYANHSMGTAGQINTYWLSRYDTTGAIDTTFGVAGTFELSSSENGTSARALAYDVNAQRVVVVFEKASSAMFELIRVWL